MSKTGPLYSTSIHTPLQTKIPARFLHQRSKKNTKTHLHKIWTATMFVLAKVRGCPPIGGWLNQLRPMTITAYHVAVRNDEEDDCRKFCQGLQEFMQGEVSSSRGTKFALRALLCRKNFPKVLATLMGIKIHNTSKVLMMKHAILPQTENGWTLSA